MGFDPSLCRCYNSFFPFGCADRNQDVQAVSPKAVNPGKNKIVIGGQLTLIINLFFVGSGTFQ
jgi:hypothetical protein